MIMQKNSIEKNMVPIKKSDQDSILYTSEQIVWNHWLAGILDGAGYFHLQNNSVAVCEITMGLEDEPLLAQIKQKLGGRLTPRSGARSVRYTLSSKNGMIDLINRVNGLIRNSVRIPQFQKICDHFSIPFVEANGLTKKNGYMAGIFDAKGTVTFVISKSSQSNSIKSGTLGKIHRLSNSQNFHKLEISIRDKDKKNLIYFQKTFGFGKIRVIGQKKSQTHIYILNSTDIPEFIEYTKNFPLRSTKRKRIWALKQYFDLKRWKAHLAPDGTIQRKAWISFCKKWYL
jgi:ubiquinol-cytochrome c reductase cytochrome b subunit